MRLAAAAAALLMSMSASALAQGVVSGNDSSVTMAKLVGDGYEIKTAVPNGGRYIVFLQKDRRAYACEFVTLTASRCGEIK